MLYHFHLKYLTLSSWWSLSYRNSPLIWSANQWSGFFMIGTSVMKKLNWKPQFLQIAIFSVKLLFFLPQRKPDLYIPSFYFFLPWISWIIRIVSSKCFALFQFIFELYVCSALLFFKFAKIWKKHPLEVFNKKSILKNFAKLIEKYLCQSRTDTLLRKRLWHRYSSCGFYKKFWQQILKELFWTPALSLLLKTPHFFSFSFF